MQVQILPGVPKFNRPGSVADFRTRVSETRGACSTHARDASPRSSIDRARDYGSRDEGASPSGGNIVLCSDQVMEDEMVPTTSVLNRPTLVLNSRWQAVHVTTVMEAISLVVKRSAVILDPETFETHVLDSWDAASKARKLFEGRVIRSAKMTLAEPEIILLKQYDGRGERSVVFSRRNIFKRDKHTCQYCGAQPPVDELTIDHILPKSRRGVSSWTNCVLSCIDCNKRKANRTPEEAKMTLRKKPVKPDWESLAHIPTKARRESWKQFIDRSYWEAPLNS